ncbi:Uncharacterized protein APZ42_006826, partial [Daphnia magna]
WNSRSTDPRGMELESLFFMRNLSIANIAKSKLDFVPGGTSFIDVTFAGHQVKFNRWLFLPIPSLSDHPYIYFEIHSAAPPLFPSPSTRKGANSIPSPPCIDQLLFSSSLVSMLYSNPPTSLTSLAA